MRLLSVHQCKPGDRLAKPLYTDNGTTLIGEGVELTQKMLDRLVALNVTSVYIHDSRTDDIIVEDIVSAETRREAMQAIQETFRSMQHDQQPHKLRMVNGQLDRRFRQVISAIIDELKQNRSAMNLLGSISGYDHYVFTHSFNVALYSVSLGMKAGLNDKELSEIGLGGILHDVGKMLIPQEILNKPGKLTKEEFEVVKKHTEYGFEILRKQDEISLLAAHCAYQHHERCDGSGYPRQLKREQIHRYALIMGICDVFDALTTQRVYRKSMPPHTAMEFLYAGVERLFVEELVLQFRETVALYPVGMNVTLNTGEAGIVVEYKQSAPTRPTVRILNDPAGKALSHPYDIDLAKQLNLVIVESDPLIPPM
ncbi:HD-GYP domain-containing protein [Brevibacillus fulvus]|uniref:Nucleotidyltransferase with HDIG domain n=1 Tax=Brevibacillus fulvus TaxID=1125967 RepID=A0A939BVS5_9BACL|nr:HD-GYP domain-containing protein [Brevibacillus fulvus]MBM7591016.1 putative nucleotidyltransferase with HDIG domain [Brevibacillus fulvus]